MTVRSGAFTLLLAWVAFTAQTKPVQLPPQALNQFEKPPVATVEARPNPAVVNAPVVLQVAITPAVNGPLQYEVYVNGARLKECPTDSPVCQWTAGAPGDYAFHAIVRRGPGSPALTIGGPRSILTVQAPPVATPAQTPPAPDKTPDQVAPLPELAVKLLSPKVVAGEPARFSVSLVNASPLEYAIDMGDGKPVTKTDAEFTYTYPQPGTATIVASYPVGSPIVRSNLDVTIEPAPPPPIALPLPAVPDPAAGQPGVPVTPPIVVNPAFPRTWIYIVVGIVGLAVLVRVFKRPPPTPATSPPPAPHAPPVVPAATFHPHPDDALRFEPSKGNGIALEVHYVPNVASLRYTPRVRISEEQS